MSTMQTMLNTIPQVGQVRWLGLRPAAKSPMEIVETMEIDIANSVVGDHFSGKAGSKRQVTLIQAEHLDAVSAILEKEVLPEQLRRNIVVSGINLLSLKEQNFQIGGVVLRGTGNCQPCSRMEKNLGPGGYNAMRGHGGITASVIESGEISLGDSINLILKAD